MKLVEVRRPSRWRQGASILTPGVYRVRDLEQAAGVAPARTGWKPVMLLLNITPATRRHSGFWTTPALSVHHRFRVGEHPLRGGLCVTTCLPLRCRTPTTVASATALGGRHAPSGGRSLVFSPVGLEQVVDLRAGDGFRTRLIFLGKEVPHQAASPANDLLLSRDRRAIAEGR